MKGRAVVSETCQRIQLKKAGLRDAPKNSTRHEDHAMERVLKEGRSSQLSDSFSPQIGRDPTFLTENSCEFDRARMRRKDLIYLDGSPPSSTLRSCTRRYLCEDAEGGVRPLSRRE